MPHNVHHMGTRSNNIPLIKSNRNYFKNSFFPKSISAWNILDSTLKEKEPLGSLKCGILDIIRPKKKSIFGIHDPVGVKWLFQLRVGLSPLHDLYDFGMI